MKRLEVAVSGINKAPKPGKIIPAGGRGEGSEGLGDLKPSKPSSQIRTFLDPINRSCPNEQRQFVIFFSI